LCVRIIRNNTQVNMAGTRDIIADTLRLLANHPILGPTPNQQLVAVPINTGVGDSLVGGGNGPSQSTVTITTTTITPGLTVIMPLSAAPLAALWPRTGGVGTSDNTGFLPIPTITNGVPVGGFTVQTPYLKGKLILPIRITSSGAPSVPAVGFSNSLVAFQLFVNTAPSAVPLFIENYTFVNPITAVAHAVDVLITFPINEIWVLSTTGVNMFCQITNTDTAMTFSCQTTPGQLPLLVIDN
jgi:hypothetical protein